MEDGAVRSTLHVYPRVLLLRSDKYSMYDLGRSSTLFSFHSKPRGPPGRDTDMNAALPIEDRVAKTVAKDLQHSSKNKRSSSVHNYIHLRLYPIVQQSIHAKSAS
eukprot:1158432-Pelagomonas_calceolata.AAC.2